ncbi:MAG TPA: transglycosylase SLT domain-containing protein [Bryobacteraceae bacterium]|nr:transglycosylase SLT domain-containing protein [Bryobacteraceae bacterium]
MTHSHRVPALIAGFGLLAALLATGCATKQQQAFKLSFLPSTPAPVVPTFEAPPQVATNFYASDSPDLVQRALAAANRPAEVDSRIAKARDHVDAGKRFYQLNDLDAARREFDAALDVLLSAPDSLPNRQRLETELDQITDTIYRYDLEGLGSSATQQAEVVYDKSPLDSILTMTFPTDPNLRPKVKEEIEATVSQLPLQENDAVLSYVHYFSTDRGRKVLISGLRRSGRYRPLVQRILDDEGVPQELIYLAQAESGFLPRARSYKQAVGMWQFVQFRGRQYGLMQGPGTDDRLDPEKATRAAAKHLHDLYAMFGDWYLAMAAYNCGPGCVERAVERTGYADFWDLKRLNALPKETANYVPIILAVTIMAKNPKDYDLENLDMDRPMEYDSLELDTPTSLALIADAADRPVSEIQDLNPSVLRSAAPAGYALRVPKGSLPTVMAALDMVPANHRADWRLHRVVAGETLAEIAHRYSTPVASLTAANQHASADAPIAGDLLVVPSAGHVSHTAARTLTAGSRTHAKGARNTVASRRATVNTPARKTRSTPYRTASLTARHRTSAN